MAGKFEIYENSSGQWRFRLKASNGETVATGAVRHEGWRQAGL